MSPDRLPPAAPERAAGPGRVPVEELIDLAGLGLRLGRPPHAREIRAVLPRGWALEPDGRHARRDLRLFFREGWILLVGMIAFGGVALAIFWQAFPRGWRGLATLAGLVLAVLVASGLVGPLVTRALYRGRR